MWLDPLLQNWVKQNGSDTTGSLHSSCLRLQVVGQVEEDESVHRNGLSRHSPLLWLNSPSPSTHTFLSSLSLLSFS